MKPPLYFGLKSALEGQREFGGPPLSIEEIRDVSSGFREAILKSVYKEQYRKEWRAFIEEDPGDKAAMYMKEFV